MHFDDARLEDEALAAHEGLRRIASTGARLRRLALSEPLGALPVGDRPRGILIVGPEARLIRAVLEPVCPVPFMAWSGPGLPAWVGPLDLVLVIGGGADAGIVDVAAEATRRGATMLVAAPEQSHLADVTSGSDTILVPLTEPDATSAAVALLTLLGQLGLGPMITLELLADAVDLVAQDCSPMRDLSVNPGKELALQLADRLPLIWGGTVLASRAGRRLGEAIRRVSGVPALAADASELLAVLSRVERRDPFADPDDAAGPEPVLVLLDPDRARGLQAELARDLERQAEAVGVRVARLTSGQPDDHSRGDVESYLTLLTHALYGAEYLGIGLQR